MKLYPDKPMSQGVENALKRAHQMVDIQWTPVERYPAIMPSFNANGETERIPIWHQPWRTKRGMAYSSVRPTEKYVGFNVSLETFWTALANPKSVLYTRCLHGTGKGLSSYYGIVCSAFASYVVGFPYRTPNYCMPHTPGITEVDTSTLDNLQLCDLIQYPGHVAVVTGLQRDAEGKVHVISVSESTNPFCICTDFTPESFRTFWLERGGYRVYRYAGVHQQTYTPSPYVHVEGDPDLDLPPVNSTFMTDFGNKANYKLGEQVEFHMFEQGWESIQITGPGGALTLLIAGEDAAFTPDAAGFYTALCRKGDTVSQELEFAVVGTSTVCDKPVYKVGGEMSITFSNDAGDEMLLYAISTTGHNERQRGYFTPEELTSGKATFSLDLAPGDYYIYTVSKNKYGYYASVHCPFSVEE